MHLGKLFSVLPLGDAENSIHVLSYIKKKFDKINKKSNGPWFHNSLDNMYIRYDMLLLFHRSLVLQSGKTKTLQLRD